MKYTGCLLWLWGAALAQSPLPEEDPLVRIALERAQWQAEREAIERTHETRNRDCWQRFAVNACLSEVRRSRRAALEPVRAGELALNAQERAWRIHLRDERLRDRAEGGAHDRE